MRRSVIGFGVGSVFAALALAPALLAQDQGKQRQQQQQGDQTLRVGQQAPALDLMELAKGQVIVLEWIDPTDLSWVRFHKGVQFKQLCGRFKDQGLVWMGVCSFPAQGEQPKQGMVPFGREELMRVLPTVGLDFPVLYDEGGQIARRFGITHIPHVVIMGQDGRVAFEGPIAAEEGLAASVQDIERALDQAIRTEGSLPAGAPRDDQQQTPDRSR